MLEAHSSYHPCAFCLALKKACLCRNIDAVTGNVRVCTGANDSSLCNRIMSEKTDTPILFLDFDGTVSERDAVDLILENYADPAWLEREEAWRKGFIGSRECLRAQIDLVRAMPDELNDLLDTIRVDEGLLPLLETCATHNVPVHIISDGFDRCIERVLARASPPKLATLLRRVRVFSSHLEFAGQARWRTSFPFFPQTCGHNCATCKLALMQALNERNAPTIFVGDGLSDKYAAACADLVFAKKSLANYCRENSVPYIPYDTLHDVAAYLAALLRSNSNLQRRAIRDCA